MSEEAKSVLWSKLIDRGGGIVIAVILIIGLGYFADKHLEQFFAIQKQEAKNHSEQIMILQRAIDLRAERDGEFLEVMVELVAEIRANDE